MGFGVALPPTKLSEQNTRLATGQTVASLARHVMPLSVESSVSKAIETLRHSTLDTIPVVSGSRIVTMLSDLDIAALLIPLPESSQAHLRLQPLAAILDRILALRPPQAVLYATETVTAASEFFISNPAQSAVAIVDGFRSYVGILSRVDLLAYQFKTLSPARVGGMATPLGVYLTDGISSGGVGDAGLFLAGATLTSLFAVAMIISNGLDMLACTRHVDIEGMVASRLIPLMPTYAVTLVTNVRTVFPLILMFMLLRLIPVAGYHAAEHQVVHCIEQGEPLLVSNVARMPRPHPRCGTNLVSGVMLFGLYFSLLSGLLMSTSAAVVPAALATLMTWRQVGTFLQQFFTTRTASKKQLESGIRAGEDLLAKFQLDINRRANWPMRIWRMGFAQMLAGSAVPALILYLLDKFVPVVQPYLQGIY